MEWGKDKIEKDWKTEIEVRQNKDSYKITQNCDMKRMGKSQKQYGLNLNIWNNGTKDLKDLIGEKLFAYPKSVSVS